MQQCLTRVLLIIPTGPRQECRTRVFYNSIMQKLLWESIVLRVSYESVSPKVSSDDPRGTVKAPSKVLFWEWTCQWSQVLSGFAKSGCEVTQVPAWCVVLPTSDFLQGPGRALPSELSDQIVALLSHHTQAKYSATIWQAGGCIICKVNPRKRSQSIQKSILR